MDRRLTVTSEIMIIVIIKIIMASLPGVREAAAAVAEEEEGRVFASYSGEGNVVDLS